MTTKPCISCGEEKLLDSFYKHPDTVDGRMGRCKACCKWDAKKNRAANIDRIREYDRERGRTEARKKHVRANAYKYAHKQAGYARKTRAKNPESYKARTAVGNAIRAGKLVRGSCEMKGCWKKAHAHHEDYSKPLEVRWLCAEHHGLVHRKVAA